MVLRLALGITLWLCSAHASAQLAAMAPEPAGFREPMRRGTLLLELGDLAGAESAYGSAYRLWPSAEAQWGLGRIACARSNFGDCTAWLRAALEAALIPLSAEQRDSAVALLQLADEARERAFSPSQPARVIVLPPPAGPLATVAHTEREQLASGDSETHHSNRAVLWTVASMVAAAALAGVLVGITAQPGR